MCSCQITLKKKHAAPDILHFTNVVNSQYISFILIIHIAQCVRNQSIDKNMPIKFGFYIKKEKFVIFEYIAIDYD